MHGVMGIVTLTVLFLPLYKKQPLKWQFFMHVPHTGAQVAVMLPLAVNQQKCKALVVTVILNTF